MNEIQVDFRGEFEKHFNKYYRLTKGGSAFHW